ncbi:MAG: rod shape-determining protein MreC [Phototrophicales bacterium]|nr:MAG: rod shape-determining protein MreC [Phototrophicales bacterium]
MLTNRSPRSTAISFSIFISIALIILSLIGTLSPVENVARIPLTFLQNIFGEISTTINSTSAELAEVRSLRQRNQELEEALAAFQAEVAESREIRNDYERLAALVNYVTFTRDDWQFVAADVIGRDSSPTVRVIHLNKGTRDGVEIGDPVVTDQGLVGRVTQVSATGCEVLLITDQTSAVEVRLQSTRDLGLVRGTLSGDIVLSFVDADAQIIPNDLVLTSGATQRFPPDIIVGQITNPTLSEDRLFREAPMVSFVDFNRLEIVLIITNWEPVDLAVFDEDEP